MRDRIVAETRGNPLALLELPRGLTPAELRRADSGCRTRGRWQAGSRRASAGGWRRCRRRRSSCCWSRRPSRSASRRCCGGRPSGSGSEPEAATPAAEAGLLEFGARVRFRHPLVRSAVYRAASSRGPPERAPGAGGGDRSGRRSRSPRLAPRACGAGPDEDVARELERSAGRAQARGGLAAAAAFLERATELTPEPARRAQRALAAAQAKHEAGAPDAALGLLATAQAGPLDELQRARVDLLRAQIAFAVEPRPRRAAAAARGRQAARAARRHARARDLPGRVVGRDHRRPPGRRRRCAGGRRGGDGRAPGAAAAARRRISSWTAWPC